LYEQSKLKNQKLKELNTKVYGQFNHKPIINNSSREIIKSSFQERQEEYQKKVKSKQIE